MERAGTFLSTLNTEYFPYDNAYFSNQGHGQFIKWLINE